MKINILKSHKSASVKLQEIVVALDFALSKAMPNGANHPRMVKMLSNVGQTFLGLDDNGNGRAISRLFQLEDIDTEVICANDESDYEAYLDGDNIDISFAGYMAARAAKAEIEVELGIDLPMKLLVAIRIGVAVHGRAIPAHIY